MAKIHGLPLNLDIDSIRTAQGVMRCGQRWTFQNRKMRLICSETVSALSSIKQFHPRPMAARNHSEQDSGDLGLYSIPCFHRSGRGV
jgi:hypothetical protein